VSNAKPIGADVRDSDGSSAAAEASHHRHAHSRLPGTDGRRVSGIASLSRSSGPATSWRCPWGTEAWPSTRVAAYPAGRLGSSPEEDVEGGPGHPGLCAAVVAPREEQHRAVSTA